MTTRLTVRFTRIEVKVKPMQLRPIFTRVSAGLIKSVKQIKWYCIMS